MYTETKEQLLTRIRAMKMSKNNRERVLYLVELAYKSGHHDGWYEHVEIMRPNNRLQRTLHYIVARLEKLVIWLAPLKRTVGRTDRN